MARFDLAKYATVAERIKMLYEEFPDARLITENITTQSDRAVSTWVVKATLYLNAGDQSLGLAKATGHAFEVDGGSGANLTSALENAESSAVGRCLALAGWAANKDQYSLASREEMQKVQRGLTPQPAKDWLKEADKIMNIDAMRWLYAQAKEAGASQEILEELIERARVLSAEGEGAGAGGSVPAGKKSGASK